jgi:hypothetical protein
MNEPRIQIKIRVLPAPEGAGYRHVAKWVSFNREKHALIGPIFRIGEERWARVEFERQLRTELLAHPPQKEQR